VATVKALGSLMFGTLTQQEALARIADQI